MTGVHYFNENVKNCVCKNIYKVIYENKGDERDAYIN